MEERKRILWHTAVKAFPKELERFRNSPFSTKKAMMMTYEMFNYRHIILTATFLRLRYPHYASMLKSNKTLPDDILRAIRLLYTLYHQISYDAFMSTFRDYRYNHSTQRLERYKLNQQLS